MASATIGPASNGGGSGSISSPGWLARPPAATGCSSAQPPYSVVAAAAGLLPGAGGLELPPPVLLAFGALPFFLGWRLPVAKLLLHSEAGCLPPQFAQMCG